MATDSTDETPPHGPPIQDGNVVLQAINWAYDTALDGFSGFEGARAGIMMKAKPALGTPSYSQGWGPAVDWTDRGQTHQMGQATQVKAGSYTDVLVIKETATSEVGAEHFKYYAKGVGNVRVGWSGADKTKETLELVRVETMSAKMMDDIRARALKLEKSAYQRSKTVYGPTAPAERAK